MIIGRCAARPSLQYYAMLHGGALLKSRLRPIGRNVITRRDLFSWRIGTSKETRRIQYIISHNLY